MNVVIGILNVALLIALAFWWWRKISAMRIFFWPALVIKLSSGLLLGVVYTYYYTIGDTFAFFRDGTVLAGLAREDFSTYLQFLWNGDESFSSWSQLAFQQPRSLFLTKLVSLFNLLSFDNYWITSLYFSFICFAASWILVSTLTECFPRIKVAAVLAFLFFPSVVFWGSGIIKESLALASLCFLSAIFLKLWENQKVSVSQWIVTFIAVWILWNLKYYFAAVFIPVVVTSYLVGHFLIPRIQPKRNWGEYLIWFIVFALLLFTASFIHPNFYPVRFLEVIVSNYNAFQQISRPEDMVHFNDLQANGISALLNSPWALVSGLFRPFLWESGNAFQLLMAIENTVLLVLFIASLIQMRKLWATPNRLLILSLIVYIVGLCIFITLSTPNFGTLSRYRIGYIPFFALLIMIDNPVIDWVEKFIQRLWSRLVR